MILLTSEDMRDLRAAASESGVNLRESYSGRGMRGTACIGIVTSDPGRAGGFRAALRALNPALEEALGSSSSDSMGRATIVYWRHARVPS